MSTQSLVLTVLAEDRPGVVEAVARTVAEHDGNWLESRMARLAGRFAGLLRVAVPESRIEAMTAALKSLAGVQVLVDSGGETPAGETRPLVRLSLMGHDRPGIIRDLSRELAARHANVEELTTECTSAPMSGEPLFRAEALLRVADEDSIDALQHGLEELAHVLMVEIRLEDENGA